MKKGFTLIELIIVLFILSISLALLFPALNVGQEKVSKELENTVENIQSFVNMGKAMSRKEGKSSNVFFNQDKITLTINGSCKAMMKLPSSISCRWNGNNPAQINSLGYIEDKGTIFIKSSNGKTIEITVKIGTGYVSKKK